MKASEFKKLIKEAVKEVFQEELKEILLESIKSNKSNIVESYKIPTYQIPNYSEINSQPSPSLYPPSTSNTVKVNPREAYINILNEMQQGPKNPLEGEFQIPTGPIDTISEGSSLPQGQLGIDQIANLLKPRK